MSLKPYKEKLNTPTNSSGAYSIGISKRIPEGSANLAFASSPKISLDDLSIVNEFYENNNKLLATKNSLYYSNNDYLLENANGVAEIPIESIVITDEFSLKTNVFDPKTDEIIDIVDPIALYYVATLKSPILADRTILMNSVPYAYGYDYRTADRIRADNERDGNAETDYSDITPIDNSFFVITDENNNTVDKGFKIRLTSMMTGTSNTYQVRVYNSFDREKTYSISYTDYTGAKVKEILKSNIIFNRLPGIKEIHDAIEAPWDIDNPKDNIETRLMSKVYAVEPSDMSYKVYAPTELYIIDDSMREPFEFKYRAVANIDMRYSSTDKKTLNVGVVYLNNNASNDVRGIVKSFVNEIGKTFPDYINFINPHPPAQFSKLIETIEDNKEFLDSDMYWDLDLLEPQHHINDYDLIIINGYGVHNLSAYNEVLKSYLRQGGKILIDNSSNESLELFDVDFGNNEPLINYSYNYIDGLPSILDEGKNFVLEGKYKTRHYNLAMTLSNANKIGYAEEGSRVRPQILISPQDALDWTDIIEYGSGKPSIGYKTFENRGKVYLSNSGILKAFTLNNNIETKQFVVNLILAIAEDLWVTAPWTYDRLYHVDQLFEGEIDSLNYVYDISPSNEIMAKKIISSSAKSLMSKYMDTNLNRFEGKYYVDVLELKEKVGSADKKWQPATSVFMTGTGINALRANDQVSAYATVPKPGFNVDNIQGYSKSDINVYNEKIPFTFTIRPYTYVWKNKIVKEFLPSDGKNLNIGDNFNESSLVVRKILTNGDSLKLIKGTDYSIVSKLIKLTNTIKSSEFIEVEYSNGKIFRERLYATGEHISQYSFKGEEGICKGDGLRPLGLLSDMIPKIPGDSLWADRNNTFFEVKMGFYDFGVFNEKEQRVNLRIYDKLTGEYKYTSDGENIISYNDLFGYRIVTRGDGTRTLKRIADDIIVQASTAHYIVTANKRTFSIEQVSKDKIEVNIPQGLNTNENWHPRIKYVNFIKDNFDKVDYDRWLKTLGFKFEKDYVTQRILEYFGEVNKVDKEKAIRISSSEFTLKNTNLIESKKVKLETYNPDTLKYSNISDEHYNIDFRTGKIVFTIDMEEDVYGSYTYSDFTHAELSEDTVLSIISRLNDDGVGLSDMDKEIISDAFDLIEQDLTLEYDMKEYHRQPWNPLEPLKRATNEVAKFIDTNTIKVQYPNIHIESDILDNKIEREKLEQISKNLFKSVTTNWLPNKSLSIEYYNSDSGTWNIVEPKNYKVDFLRGLVTIDTDTSEGVAISNRVLYATYSYSTINIQRKTYVNAVVNMEELERLDAFHYDVANENILGFDVTDLTDLERWSSEGYTIPKLYIKEDYKEPVIISDPTMYEIDYVRGFVKFNVEPSSRIYMSYSYTKVEPLSVADFDRNRGTIQLNEDITFNDNIFISYYYEDDYYEYKGYMDGEEFISLDLNPTRGHVCKVMTAINGAVAYKEVPTYKLLGETVYFYLMPSRTIKNSKIVSENNVTIRHIFDKDTLRLLQLAHPDLIVLGSIKLVNNYTIYDIDVLDTRTRGGGLKENVNEQEIRRVDELSQNFWDIVDYDGLEYFGNGITIVKVPKSILIENGGVFTTEDVQKIVKKHLAYGVLPIVRYYDGQLSTSDDLDKIEDIEYLFNAALGLMILR